MRSIFEEDHPVTLPEDGLTTRKEAEQVVAAVNKLALGGGVVRVAISRVVPGNGDDKPREMILANGHIINCGIMKGYLAQASEAQIELLKSEYAAPSLRGPAGINWHCTESAYYATRQKAVDLGLVVQDGGTIAEDVDDLEAIGRQQFGLPPRYNVEANFVIVFEPKPGYERPVVNAAFLAHMIEQAGAVGAKAFVKSRMVPKGWRASS